MKQKHYQRGSALLIVTVISLILMGISGVYMSISYLNTKKTEHDLNGVQALYIAEAAAALAIHKANNPPTGVAVAVATNNSPLSLSGGSFTIPTNIPGDARKIYIDYGNNLEDDDKDGQTDQADEDERKYLQIQVWGTYNKVVRKMEYLLSRNPDSVFHNAVFAGNSSGDKNYTLGFTGNGTTNDRISGDIYSGGNFLGTGQAELRGVNQSGYNTVRYQGDNSGTTVTGPTYQQKTQDPLDLKKDGAGMSEWERKAAAMRSVSDRRDVDRVAYIDVAHDLSTARYATWSSDGSGGGVSSATQITDVNQPSHMFRKDPTYEGTNVNRTNKYEYVPTATGRSDYYFEDPSIRSGTTTVGVNNGGAGVNGNQNAHAVNISPNGNNAVYFIDGNMRVSSVSAMSYKFVKPAGMGDMQMTMVVKGNVSFTDNMLLPEWQSRNDALAIIALTDPDFPNTTAADFQKTDGLPITPASGLTIDAFVRQYNTMPGKTYANLVLDPSNPASYERASQEYNKAYGSGNVYFGDPGSGTVEHFEAFMYAENNFYATNLDTSRGTSKVEIFGNMTAGNQVKIVRDTSLGYKPLKVDLDDKIMRVGGTKPPAMPGTPGVAADDWQIITRKQVP